MNAITDSNTRYDPVRAFPGESRRGNSYRVERFCKFAAYGHLPALAILGIFLISLLLTGTSALAVGTGFEVPLTPVGQITIDDDGHRIGYPLAVFYDPVVDEIYLVNAKTDRIVVYGPDFFPRVSIGTGRGILAPRGGIVMSNGEVYICQIADFKNPTPRITVLNGAFFVDREIFLDQIPDAENFTPRQVAINGEGTIYLAGDNHRGVAVLDGDGNFLRWLQPKDRLSEYAFAEIEAKESAAEEGNAKEGESLSAEDGTEESEEEGAFVDIPEEFRPRGSETGKSTPSGKLLGPVKINYVTIDSNGKLYLLSPETGKIYVYGADETLLFSFGQKGGSPGQMSQPRSLAVDNDRGLIYVVDYMRHTILTYDLAGKFLFELGGRGAGPGWFNFPSGIVLDKHGQIIVADLFNKRVQVLKVEYELSTQWRKANSVDASKTEPSDAAGERVEPAPIAQPEGVPQASSGTGEGEIKEVVMPDETFPELPESSPASEKVPESTPGEPDTGTLR